MRLAVAPNSMRQGLPFGAFLVIATVLALELPNVYGEELIARGSTWRYLDDGSDQGNAWRRTDFNDAAWASGAAQLGFGDGDEATVIASGHTTYYFRHSITIDNPEQIGGLELAILRDDGAVVYVNGTEVYRTNMPDGTISHDTLAPAAAVENVYLDHEFDSTNLVAGTNVIAVEVHQVSTASSDVSFDLSLSTTDAANDLVSLGSIWSYLDDGSDQGTAWRESGFDDSGWESGAAQLGFGDGDETTTIDSGAITYYFRHDFSVDSTGVLGLELDLRRDDGAIVYLNGTEIARSNMPTGEVAYNTFTPDDASDDGQSLHTFTLSTDALVNGNNVLAVEVHQVSLASSDVSFDLRLVQILASDDPSLVRGPYLQMGTPSSMIVRWRTDGFTDTKLSYGTEVGNLDTTIEIDALTNEHEVLITGLESSTRYFYGIGNSEATFAGGDADHFFKTSPPTGSNEPVRIWVIGDSGQCAIDQDGCDEAAAVMNEYLEWAAENGGRTADIVLMLGDNAYNDATDSETTRGLFEPFAKVLRNHVLWPVPGNHEFGASDSPTQSGPYYEAFTLPKRAEAGGVASGTEAYYSYDYGNVHFVALDSHDTDRDAPDSSETNICPGDGTGGAMYNWLCEDLAATTQDFIISYWHHPPYTKGSHDSDNREDSDGRMHDMRERFVPVLEHYGADLNLSGHSHSYERSFLIDGHYGLAGSYRRFRHAKDTSSGDPAFGAYTKDQGANQGSVYSVVGSSSKNQGDLFEHPIMVYSENIEGSVVIDIEGPQMDAYFIRNDGAVNDVYRLNKNIDTEVHFVPMFPTAMDPIRQGFARVINHSPQAGIVAIEAIDDDGSTFGPLSLEIDANETVHFNSDDLENGNESKGLLGGTGTGSGDWRLTLSSDLDFEVLAYVRTNDGFLTAMHDHVPAGEDGRYRVPIFNPGSNVNQVSQLRLANPGDESVEITITGVDDAGASPGDEVKASIPPRASTTFDARRLEAVDREGGLDDGTGKWQLIRRIGRTDLGHEPHGPRPDGPSHQSIDSPGEP